MSSEATINTPNGPAPDRQMISYDDYLRLVGLLTLAADHHAATLAILRSAMRITGEDDPLGHTADAVWGAETAEALLKRLDITVAPREADQA